MSQSVAFIGLGAMGYRMAAHLPKGLRKLSISKSMVTSLYESKK